MGRPPTVETDLRRIYHLATRRRDESRRFLRWLKYGRRRTKRQVMELQVELTNEVWAQIDCRECANCCAAMQLQLTAQDCVQAAKAVGLTTAEFQRRHAEKHRDGLWYLKAQPCLFLRDKQCSIYLQRLSRCRGFPYLHSNVLDNMAGTLEKAAYCPIVFNVLERMKAHPELQRNRRRSGGARGAAAK
ncbi:MAG: YkgJ family cysteine cluster protein [Armatimonadetes bacterium]|nr:YkgJ family cysteine cluster protein [Armatimonadota bacterium]